MKQLPTIPTPQAPIAPTAGGAISREWFVFLQALLAALVAQEARISALENQ